MTCIVAVKGKEKIVIGGDSAGVSGLDLIVRKDKKVFTNGPFTMGFTSSFRMGQVLMDMEVPVRDESHTDDYKYMRTTFIDTVMGAFERKGILKKENEVKECGEFIVVYRGNIYKIYTDFQVQMLTVPFDACGCGESYALGALAEMNRSGYPSEQPKDACKRALETAEKFSGGVRSPFNFIEIPYGKAKGG